MRDYTIDQRLKDIAYQTGLNLGRTALMALPSSPTPKGAMQARNDIVMAAFVEAIEAVCGIGDGTVYDSPQFRFDLAQAIAATVCCHVVEGPKS